MGARSVAPGHMKLFDAEVWLADAISTPARSRHRRGRGARGWAQLNVAVDIHCKTASSGGHSSVPGVRAASAAPGRTEETS